MVKTQTFRMELGTLKSLKKSLNTIFFKADLSVWMLLSILIDYLSSADKSDTG